MLSRSFTIIRSVQSQFPRALSTTSSLASKGDLFNRPSPPTLSRNEQKDFEELLRRVNAPASAPLNSDGEFDLQADREEVMHPDFRAKPRQDFEGEINPETGEVGGPKHEPLAHGKYYFFFRSSSDRFPL